MKLINQTRYDTRTLRKLFVAVFRAQPHGLQARVTTWRDLTVKIVYARPSKREERWIRAAEERDEIPAETIERVKATWERARLQHISGCASIRGYRATLRLPPKSVSVPHLAAVWVHELWHVGGSYHPDFPPAIMHCHSEPFAWTIAEFGAELSEAPPKQKPARGTERGQRYLRVLDREQAWQSKLKRAEKALQKVRAQRRYYERALALDEAASPRRKP